MDYQVKIIHSMDELSDCPEFFVDQYNWGGSYRPKTHGQLALLSGTGFVLRMTCEEADPVRTYTEPNAPVYLESAMEAFFQFFPEGEKTGYYFNFEMNANGALHAKYGPGRENRTAFPLELNAACHCTATVEKERWTLDLTIPFSLIEFVYGPCSFQAGDTFKCNFYKISEQVEPVHFGSFTEMKYDKPNFHLPEFFATATII